MCSGPTASIDQSSMQNVILILSVPNTAAQLGVCDPRRRFLCTRLRRRMFHTVKTGWMVHNLITEIRIRCADSVCRYWNFIEKCTNIFRHAASCVRPQTTIASDALEHDKIWLAAYKLTLTSLQLHFQFSCVCLAKNGKWKSIWFVFATSTTTTIVDAMPKWKVFARVNCNFTFCRSVRSICASDYYIVSCLLLSVYLYCLSLSEFVYEHTAALHHRWMHEWIECMQFTRANAVILRLIRDADRERHRTIIIYWPHNCQHISHAKQYKMTENEYGTKKRFAVDRFMWMAFAYRIQTPQTTLQ